MNIIKQLILEALWEIDDKGYSIDTHPFTYHLIRTYELEYKLSQLNTKSFNGHPKRKENIINNVKRDLIESLEFVKDVMLKVLKSWLSSHALLNPEEWAKQRLFSNSDSYDYLQYDFEKVKSDMFNSFIVEYLNEYAKVHNITLTQIHTTNLKSAIINKDIQNYIERNMDKFPEFSKFINQSYSSILQTMERDDYINDAEEYMERHNFKTDKQALDYIDNLSVDNIDLFEFNDLSTMIMEYVTEDYFEAIMIELYEKFVFPLWFVYWQSQGIEKTRHNIEKIYNNLLKCDSTDIGNFSVWVNVAINAAHQTGDILEYLEYSGLDSEDTDFKKLLTDLSESNTDKWDEELKQDGVGI